MPASVVVLLHADDGVAQLQVEGRMLGQRLHQLARQEPEVDVGAVPDLSGGHCLFGVAVLHHQRHPFAQDRVILAVFHLLEQVMLVQCRKPFAQERHILLAPHETLMADRVDEFLRSRQHAVLDQIGPELQRHLERGIDLQRAPDAHRAVRQLRRVVQLAVTRMPRPRVVQAVRAFVRHLAQALDHHDLQRRVQMRQQRSQRGAHHPRSDQQHIHFFLRHDSAIPIRYVPILT